MTQTTMNMTATNATLTGTNRLNLNGNLSFGSFLKTQSVVTTSRTFNTVYQNQRTTPIFVNVCFNAGTNGEDFAICCDSIASPTLEVAHIQIYSHQGSIFFIVPPSYYYKAIKGSSGSIRCWCEWA